MRSVERKVPTATAQTIEPPRPRVEHEPRALALTPGKRNLIEDGDDAPAAAPGKRNGARAWSAAELLDAASLDELIPLPHRAAIERRLHVDLGGVRARSGPRSRKALAALGAVAAQRGRELAFASSAPSLAVVMHEVMHVLQSAQGAGSGLAPEDSLAEREADAALTRLPRAPLAGPRRTPAEAGRALALSPAAAEVHLLRIRQVEGIWSIVDDHDAQGIDPATLDDPGRVDVIANLLLAKRLSVAQRVLLAAPDEAWRRILAGLEKDRASPGAEQLIAVLSSFLQSPIIDGVKGASRDVRARIALRAAEQGASPDTLVKLEHVLEVLSHDALLLDAEFVKKLIDHGECVSAVYMEAFKIWFKSFVEEAADERVDISKLGPRALLDLARLYPGLGGTLAAWAVQEARGYVDTVEQLLSYVVGDNQRAGAIVEAAYSERKEELALCYLPAMGRALAVDLAQTALRRVVQADCFTTKMFELLSTEVLARSDSKLFSMLTPLLLELKIALGQVDHGKSKVDYSKTFGCYLDADPGFALRVFGHGQQVLLEVLDQIDQLVLATGFHLGWFRIFPMVARVATRFGMTVEDLLAAALEDSDEPHAAAQALADALGEDLHIIVDTGGKLPNVSMSVYERIRDLIGTALHYLSKTARIQINDPNDAPRFLQILDFFQRSGHQYYRNQGGAMDAIYAQALGQVHPELKRLELGALQAAPRFVSGDFGAVLSKSFFIVRVRGTPDQLQLELDFKALMESFFHLQGALAGVQGDLVFDLTEILPKLDEKNHHGCADRLFALTEQFIVEVANRYQREHKESKGDKKKTPYDRMVKKLQNGFIRLCGFVTVDNQRLFYNFGIPGPKGAKVEEDEDGASEPEEGPKPAAKSRSGALTFYKAPLQGDKVGKLRERGYVPDILDFKLRLFDVLTSGNDLSNLRSFVDPFLLGGLGARSRERNQRVTRGGVIAQLELCRKMVHCEPSAPFVKRHYFEAFNRFFATLIAQLREPAELDDEYVPSSPETPATPFLPTADEMEGFSEEQQELGRKNTVFDEERVSTAPMFAPSGPEEQLVDRFVLDVLIDVTDQLAQLSLMPAVEGAQYNAFCDLTEGVLEDLLHVMSLHDFFPGSSATGYLEQVADDLYELDETDGLEPQFYVFNGGLHAITEVLLLAIDQKRRAKQGGELQIRYSNNVYFELIRMITKELRDVCALPYVRSPNRDTKLRARVLDGDTIEERLGTLPLKQLNALFTKLTQEPLPATREERVQGLESFGMEVTKALIDLDDPETDLIMFDIYPNDSVKSHVSKNDPVAILKRILDAPKRNKPLTAIIDTTMNFFSDEETRRLVADPRIKDAIAKGQLNLFLVNSLVK
ncbi:MAG TPA: DUF4157 domain-containing protein, partial [Polyangia bacterium]|nr:DUF4157 domain-containing protein [Polyangia bacterium]